MDKLVSINEMLDVVARRNGVGSLTLGTEGVCTLEYLDSTITLEYVLPAEALCLYAPLAAKSVLIREGKEAEVYQGLLALNVKSPDLLGATFAYIPEEELIVLKDSVPLEQLSPDVLEARLNTFMLLVQVWSRRLLQAKDMGALMEAISEEEADEASKFLLGADVELPADGEQITPPKTKPQFV